MNFVMEGAFDGAGVLVGRYTSRAIPSLTGISGYFAESVGGTSPGANAVLQGLVSIVAGSVVAYAATRIVGAREGAAVLAGTFDGVYESVLIAAMGGTVSSNFLGGPGPVGYAMRRAMAGYSRTAVMRSTSTRAGAPLNAATGARAVRVGSYSSGGALPRSRLITNGGLAGGRLR